MLRKDILDATGLSDNTTFSNALQELEQCGFIRKFMPIGGKSKNAIYQLMDNYTLFYFDFIKKIRIKTNTTGLPTWTQPYTTVGQAGHLNVSAYSISSRLKQH